MKLCSSAFAGWITLRHGHLKLFMRSVIANY